MWCMEFDCIKARCIDLHAQSVWEVCPGCGGSGWSDQATAERCVDCVGGLADVTPIRPRLVPDIANVEPVYVVTDKARQEAARYARTHGADTAELAEAAGLVPRIDSSAYAWDYAAGCPKSMTGTDRKGC